MGITIDIILDMANEQLPHKSSIRQALKNTTGKSKNSHKNINAIKNIIKKILNKLISPYQSAWLQQLNKTKKHSIKKQKYSKRPIKAHTKAPSKQKVKSIFQKNKTQAKKSSLSKVAAKLKSIVTQKSTKKNPKSSTALNKPKSNTLLNKQKVKTPIVINAIKSTITKELAKKSIEDNAKNNPVGSH